MTPLTSSAVTNYFNSRPCGRGDTSKESSHSSTLISIHAPAGGATQKTLDEIAACPISIHAPAGGATQRPHKQPTPDQYFNSRPCGRGDTMTCSL